MPSVKRDRLLSDLERERLEKRSSLDRHTRATNDVRVKRKLAAWLKGTGDVLRILNNLPEDQIRDVTKDLDIYMLLSVIPYLLRIRNFYPVEGEEDKPDDWVIAIDEKNRRLATNQDVMRSVLLNTYISYIRPFHGENNPVAVVELLEKFDRHPKYRDRVTDAERKSIKRLRQANDEFAREMGLSKESGEGDDPQ
jgi:hypothetical protein